jgi:two-component system, OmpR family, response regulator RpaB
MTKILLVEDDKSLREIYGVRLLAEGYDIVSAGDGEEALAMAIKERPQLVLSDVMMPKISGFDMLDILRSTTETKDIKVIMMTALSSEDQRTRGEALGADRYLVKSQVGIEDVVRTVHDVLGDTQGATSTPAPSTPSAPAPQSSAPTPPAPVAPSTPSFNQPQQPIQDISRPTPTAPPRPVAPPVFSPQPQNTPTSTPQPVFSQPSSVTPQPSSQPQVQPAPSPAPQPSSLPQPTAPFSTNRPANLGDRIIHPLEPTQPEPDMSGLMDQELNGSSSDAPKAFGSNSPAGAAPAQPFGAQPSDSLGFEETPRPSTPFGSGPQAPPTL